MTTFFPTTELADIGDDVVADFLAAVEAWATRPAVLYHGAALSYRELLERVEVTAARYHRPGSSPLVGALVSHTPDAIEHLLAILYAGATYCPIDAALPTGRKDALTAAMGLAPFETVGRADKGTGTALPQSFRGGDGPAYVLCTSGSTGTPKPVAVSRRALAITVRALRDLFALTMADRVLQFASLGWDTCLEEMLPALTAGSTLVFDDAAHAGSFGPFLRMLAQQGITVLDLPTAFWHELVLFLHEEETTLPGSIRLVVIGGERVDPTRLRQWRERDLGHVRLLNTYGCTETTMITHSVQLSGPGTEAAVSALRTEAPIGRPLPHVQDHIADDGELLISGAGLATGYLGMPDRTASAFPVEDHGAGPMPWFHTGDLVWRDECNLLFSRGRVDEQLKVLGVRVHPAEVETQLTTHPAVTGAVVVGERLAGRTSLSAYVVATRETAAKDLKKYLRERLPHQFVPTRVIFVESLAYTASGKVDRAATRRAAMESTSRGADR